MFLFWFGLVCIPQISWRYGDGENMIDDPSRSQLRCLRDCTSISCPNGTTTVYSCDSFTNGSVLIDFCSNNNCNLNSRRRENSTRERVCVNGTVNSVRYCVFDNVDPEVGGFQWIIDFITGQVSWHYTKVRICVILFNRVTLIEQSCSMGSTTMELLMVTTYH